MVRKNSENRSRVLAMLFHDIKTPMNCMIGNVDLAFMKAEDEVQAQLIKRAKNAGNELRLLIDELLSFDAIESGHLSVRKDIVNIGELIDDIKSSIDFMAEEKSLSLCIGYDHMENVDFISDKGKLYRICLNLLSNAIKYTGAGGKVGLWFKEEKDKKGKLWLCISVSDTGIGMSKEEMRRMYEIYQCKNTATYQNHGVGLYIVKNMVKLLSGTVKCESLSGVGSQFHVKIPIVLKKEQ